MKITMFLRWLATLVLLTLALGVLAQQATPTPTADLAVTVPPLWTPSVTPLPNTPTPLLTTATPYSTPDCVGTAIELRRGLLGYDGVSDTTLFSSEAAPERHGKMKHFFARTYYGDRAGLLQFDLPADITPDSVICNAWLELDTAWYPSDWNYADLYLYYLLKPWGEMTATWWTTGLGQDWAVPGAYEEGTDYEANPFAMVTIARTCWEGGGHVPHIQVKTAVERWLADPGSNLGFLLVLEGNASQVAFHSSEYNEESQERPRLHIIYGPPATETPVPAPSSTPTPTAEVADGTKTPTVIATSTATPGRTPTRTPTPLRIYLPIVTKRSDV